MKTNTNLSSLIVQSSLKTSTNGLNTAIERMTTGFKINHAKDNAANYSINTQIGTKLSSFNVVQDNVAMGLDMLMTAMDSLDLISSHLSRMRDLAEQAANGTYSLNSLNAIESEINTRSSEINRLISMTEYNGIKLFNKTAQNEDEPVAESQGGEFIKEIKPLTEEEALAQGYTIIKTVDDLKAITNDLSGKYILMEDIDLNKGLCNVTYDFSGEFNGNGHVIKNVYNGFYSSRTPPKSLFGNIRNAKISNLGLEDVYIIGGRYVAGLANNAYDSTITNCYVNGTIESHDINSETGGLIGEIQRSQIEDCYTTGKVIADSVTGYSFTGGLIGVDALRSGSSDILIKNCFSSCKVSGGVNTGGIVGDAMNGMENCYFSGSVSGKMQSTGALIGSSSATGGTIINCKYYEALNPGIPAIGKNTGGSVDIKEVSEIPTTPLYKVDYSLPDDNNDETLLPDINSLLTFQVGINSNKSSQISIVKDLFFDFLPIDVSTSENAKNAISQIDDYLKNIRDKQTELGSAYNRLESVLESIGVNIDNLTYTQSTIRDADIAEESSAYIRNQILQQASATLLATANQTPAIALQLL